MKDAQGVCKFCGQAMVIQVPEEFTQEVIDEEIVRACDCPEAQAYTKQQEDIASAERMIRDFFKGKEDLEAIKNHLLSAVEDIATGRLSTISMSRSGYTGSMKPTKDGIKVSLKYTTVDSVES